MSMESKHPLLMGKRSTQVFAMTSGEGKSASSDELWISAGGSRPTTMGKRRSFNSKLKFYRDQKIILNGDRN